MKTICLYFQVHQPFRFRRYRFFDIGNDHYYFDDYTNESILNKIAANCYLPANKLLLKLLTQHKGKFKVAFSITGVAMEQFKLYAPEVLDSFRALAATGQVEFLAETYAHSLVALKDEDAFRKQVTMHSDMVEELFGQKPLVFRNTELIYSDHIGDMVARMGFKAMLTEGAKHVLGWKSPNFLYCNAINPRLKVLLKNYKLSDDIAFRFGDKGWHEWPLTSNKFAGWLKDLDKKEEVVNLFMDYETFGEHQKKESGVFEFLEYLPAEILKHKSLKFGTPSEVAARLQVVAPVNVPNPISWADEERDLTAWLGNEMQQEAFDKLYAQLPKMNRCTDSRLLKDWNYLQCSDHFYYMCTKFFSDGDVHAYFNPYETPYEAFINYMNVLSDFAIRLNAAVPFSSEEKELANLSGILEERDQKIKKLEEELQKLRSRKRTNTSGKTSRSAGTASTAASTKGKKAQKSAAKTKSKK
ncbi:polysaccharide deacetylase family protein [Marinilabilia salmonicolor]|jgi:alpha-amylase|uniref:Alpha-amylase n=1 Tax=Marinilabilia salmonicolor TaxID=989 RepID=A0A2T0XLL0_9BACT|nr:polysaccharide deacetylase family protein [Marinilabilia salmonicolor]PRY99823.1 alpha-amylase [Marinilabilia salmonicolor]RCW37380.1 alpha-amylase [Marinilabilia salmonicolor]